MNLFILRHASAGTSRTNPDLDVKRPLDKDGKRHCLQLVYVLNAMDIQFDLIVSSPLKRSLQTASFVGTETGYESPILQASGLAPGGTFDSFQEILNDHRNRENLLVVGHEPNLSAFLGVLLNHETSSGARVRLRKGPVAR